MMIPRHELGAQKSGGNHGHKRRTKECPTNIGFENTICLEFTGKL